jgi:SAM-dependent methyltransferase
LFPIGPQLAEQRRSSHGFEQCLIGLPAEEAGRVLDIGEFTQANVTFIIGLGHRLTFEDLLRSVGDPDGMPTGRLTRALDFPENSFDAALIWDVFEHIPPHAAEIVVSKLYRVVRPGGRLFACFHAETRDQTVDRHAFRIVDSKTLLLQPRGRRKVTQAFNNRAIEKLFAPFSSVKFFLTRDSIREVVVSK